VIGAGALGNGQILRVATAALRGSMSPKSYNNDIGVPLAIFPADPIQDFLVLEIGTNHPGEIKLLSDYTAASATAPHCKE